MKTQNTFSDGINMDVNPLVAPKTVMSNCLNGTLITYNGNENVLQNDMGNGKVHQAYLPNGWVPVGMEEYGGIIYVAAYNPETGKSQLGSFPSPQQNFENTRNAQNLFTLVPNKYKVFEDKDLELKPGNKIAILLEKDLYKITEPNFNVDFTKHKKHWNILLELLTSNGALTDITEYLINPVNVPINQDYFFISADTSKLNNRLIPDLLEDNLRVYSGTLIGVPYVEVQENLADSMEVELYPGIEEKENCSYPIFKINCTIRSSSLLYNYLPLNDLLEKGLIGILYDIDALDNEGDDYKSTGKIYLDETAELGEIINIEKLNIDERDYVINISAILKPDIQILRLNASNDNLTLKIYPIFRWDKEDEPQESLTYKQTFEALKIGTGLHQINQWRYYYTEDIITLIWGMESYPSMDENIYELLLSFIDLNGDIVYTQALPHEYYNGEFTELFASNIFTSKTPYIAKISWKVGLKAQADYRWLIPTPLYNDFYQSKMVLDFSFKKAVTPEEIEMLSLKTIEGNILKFINTPEEIFTHTGEDFPIFFTVDPNINNLIISNTYKYTLNPRIGITEELNNYPFLLVYNQPSKVTYTHNGTLYNDYIENVLSIEHKVQYRNTNVMVTKLFANHNMDIIKEAKCFLVIEIYRDDDDDFFHKDDNLLGYFAYDVETKTKTIDYLELDSDNTDGTVELKLNWDTISRELTKLRNKYSLFIIPVVFTNRKLVGLNYAIQKEENWCLYWGTEQTNQYLRTWRIGGINLRNTYTSLLDMFASNLDYKLEKITIAKKFNVPAIVYEARTEYWGLSKDHQLGFPFYRNDSVNGINLEGYLIKNDNDTFIEEEEIPFKFEVETDDITLEITLNSRPYNTVILEWLNTYFMKELQLSYTNKDKIKECLETIEASLVFNGSTARIKKEYEYVNLKPSNFDIWLLINNYNISGIPSAVKVPYLENNKVEYKYIIPKEELDGNTVYRMDENGQLKEFNLATIELYDDTYYIVPSRIAYHNPEQIESKVNSDYCYVKLGELYSFRGEELFGTTKNIWSTY